MDSCQDLEQRFVLLRYVFAPDVAVYFDAEVDLDSMSLSSHLKKKEEKQHEIGLVTIIFYILGTIIWISDPTCSSIL